MGSVVYATVTEKAVSAMQTATVAGAVVTGTCAAYHLWTINGKREERMTECNKLKSRLNEYIAEFENRKIEQKKNMTDYQNLMDLNMQ